MIGAIAVLLAAAPAAAQMRGVCLPHAIAVAKLEQGYGEHRVGLGIGPGGGTVYELYVSDTGTWTIVITGTNGLTCIAASGKGWITTPLLPGDPT